MWAVAKSYMRKDFLIYEEMRKYLLIHEEAVSHVTLQALHSGFLFMYMREILFSLLSLYCKWFTKYKDSLYISKVPAGVWFVYLKVVTSEKIGGSGVMSTLGTWYGGVVMGVLLPFNEAAILYRHFNCAPLQKQKIIFLFTSFIRIHWYTVPPTFQFTVWEDGFDYIVFFNKWEY